LRDAASTSGERETASARAEAITLRLAEARENLTHATAWVKARDLKTAYREI